MGKTIIAFLLLLTIQMQIFSQDDSNLNNTPVPVEDPVVQQETKKINYKHKENYLSVDVGINFIVPINETTRIMEIGCNPFAYINYNLAFTTMIMSLGIFSGFGYEQSKNLIAENYSIFSAPLGINIGFRTNLNSPFMAAIEINSGAVFNLIIFKAQAQSSYNTLVTKYFIMPAFGAGYKIYNNLTLSIFSSFLLTFFDNSIFQGISAGIRCELGL